MAFVLPAHHYHLCAHAVDTTGIISTIGMANDKNLGSELSESEEEQAPTSDRYDVFKLVGGQDGKGFNQFDPVLTTTGFLSR